MHAGRRGASIVLLGAALWALDAAAEPSLRVYQVQPGDTLWSIAATAIGDPSLWPAVYRANRDQIKDPNQVYPGQQLTIPEVPQASVPQVRRTATELLGR